MDRATLRPPISLKMLRETLCRAQSNVAHRETDRDAIECDMRIIGGLIRQIDAHRPLGPDGKHGDLHTATCGCTLIEPDRLATEPFLKQTDRIN